MVVDAEVVVHARLSDGRHQERRRLLAALITAGGLPRFERQEQTVRQVSPLAPARTKGARQRRNHIRAGQHVARDRELVGLLVTAPRHAARSGVAEGAIAIQAVYLTDLALAVLSEKRAQRDVDRHALSEEREPLPTEVGIDACPRGDRAARRKPRCQAPDVRSRGGDGDAERTGLAIARCDGKGVKINHLFNLYHGGTRDPARFLLMNRPDLVLYGGNVVTLDPALRVAEAVAITGDRITEVGARTDLRRLVGRNTRLVDLRGRAVVPGLVDAHAHMDREGLKSLYPSLAGARSIDDVLQRIEPLVKAAEPGDWIVTMPLGDPPYYFDVPGNLREARFPTRHDLDRVAPRNPVYIRSIWGYWRHTLPLVSIANSAALRLAGVTRATVAPWDGIQIEKDSGSEPTGVFVEQTYIPVVELSLMAAAPRFTHQDRVRGLRESMKIYNSTGTTSVVEGHGVADEVMRVYDEAARRSELTVRAHLTVSPSWGAEGAAAIESRLAAWRPRIAGRGRGDAFLRVAGLVAETSPTADGAVRARAMSYTGWAGFSYDAALPRQQLKSVLLAAARADIRILSMGSGLLDLYEEVNRVVQIRDRRWVIEHIGILTADEIGRIRDLGVVLTTHTNRYLYKEGDVFRAQVGPSAEDTIVPLLRLKEAGVHVALATDNVPPSLFLPVWQAVARIGRSTNRVIAPAQRLSRADALRAATLEGAYVTFEEDAAEPAGWRRLELLSPDPATRLQAELVAVGNDDSVVLARAHLHEFWRKPRGRKHDGSSLILSSARGLTPDPGPGVPITNGSIMPGSSPPGTSPSGPASRSPGSW